MEFTILFLAILIAMALIIRGMRKAAFGLSIAIAFAAAATLLHHSTDALNLSF